MKGNIKLTLGRQTPVKVAALMRVVVSRMKDNPHYPMPLVPLDAMSAKEKELTAAILEAIDGSGVARAVRNKVLAEAKEMLNKQADYVRGIANGDKEILATSGFELQRDRTYAGVPEAPVNLQSAPIGGGAVRLRWSRVRGAAAYMVERTNDDPSSVEATWSLLEVTVKARITIKGLVRLKEAWYRVRAVGAEGTGLYSNPKSAFAL